jgi:hypothetical protein
MRGDGDHRQKNTHDADEDADAAGVRVCGVFGLQFEFGHGVDSNLGRH